MRTNHFEELDPLNKQVIELTEQRNEVLRNLRKKCKHLRLIEYDPREGRPKRMCIDCGAYEEGWHCGYQVLAVKEDSKVVPHVKTRRVIERTSDFNKFLEYKKPGPSYHVGQNHPNFSGGGVKTYKQLTQVLK